MQKTVSYDLKLATALLTDVAKTLAGAAWFSDNGWQYSVHNFPPPPAAPESVTLHVFKPHWYNRQHQGIHFETFLSAQQWRDGEMPVMLHILHTPVIPGTTLKRIKLSTPFVDSCYDMVSEWPGYSFRTGKYGTQPFSCRIKFDLDNPDKSKSALEKEFTRLCKKLGPLMDSSLAEVLASAKAK